MKTRNQTATDDMRPEYDFDYSKAVRGKYCRRLLKEGANIVLIDPEVLDVFPDAATVNETLRALAPVLRGQRRRTARRRS